MHAHDKLVTIALRMQRDEIETIDEIIGSRPELRTRSDVVRYMLRRALAKSQP